MAGSGNYIDDEEHLFAAFKNYTNQGTLLDWKQLDKEEVKDVKRFKGVFSDNLEHFKDIKDGEHSISNIKYEKKTIISEEPGNSNHYIYWSKNLKHSVLIYSDSFPIYNTYIKSIFDGDFHLTEYFSIPENNIIRANILTNPNASHFLEGDMRSHIAQAPITPVKKTILERFKGLFGTTKVVPTTGGSKKSKPKPKPNPSPKPKSRPKPKPNPKPKPIPKPKPKSNPKPKSRPKPKSIPKPKPKKLI